VSADVFHTDTPHAPLGFTPLSTLAEWRTAARVRTLEAAQAGDPVDPRDHWTALALGTRIAQEARTGQWCEVAALLCLGEVPSWHKAGVALDMSAERAHVEFVKHLERQVELYRRTGLGITPAKAADLCRLADAVPAY